MAAAELPNSSTDNYSALPSGASNIGPGMVAVRCVHNGAMLAGSGLSSAACREHRPL